MEALKKAYAEMILTSAKEAAARVMAAELRSRRVEEDLISGKEESARMLVRLKQMLDAKMNEAEMASLNQQIKVDELESQLNEAEGIILDLRAELNQAREQLDELKNRNLQHNEKAEKNCDMTYNLCNSSTDINAFNYSASTSEPAEEIFYEKNEDVSVVRRSLRKRKLKSWDNYITSRELKKPCMNLSCCVASKVKRSLGKDKNVGDNQMRIEDGNHDQCLG